LDRNNSHSHRSAEQKSQIQTCTLPFTKITREHNISGSIVYIRNQTSIKVWPLRLELLVFTRSPIEYYNACFSFHLLDQRPTTGFPFSPNRILKAPDFEQSTLSLPMLLEQTHFHAKMISSFAGFQTFLHPHSMLSFFPPSGFPFCSLLLTKTTTNISDGRYCAPDPSSYSNRLPFMQNAPQCYSLDPSKPPHTSALPFHESFSELLGQVAGATENYNNQPSFPKTALYSSKKTLLNSFLPNSHLPFRPVCSPPSYIYLANEFVWTSQLSAQHRLLSFLLPSFLPPPLINAAPSLTIIGAASFLHSITAQQREKPPHAMSVAVMERFRLQK